MAINLDHVTEQITVTDTATDASLTVNTKGTGAFNVAAGANGLNLSNGGTVTVVTSTNPGSAYTSIPTVNITAPTTAGGVQAVITTNVAINAATIGSGGTGYTVGNVLTLVGGTTTGGASTWTVATVSGGVVTSVTSTSPARYTAFPSLPASVTGGSGSGFTFSALSGFVNQFVIANAGSGYVDQPTITFTGGGGSAAAAFATIGSNTAIRTQGSYASFYSSNSGSESLRLYGNDVSGGQFQQTAGPGMFILPAQSGFGALRLGSVVGFHSLWLQSGSDIAFTTGANGTVGAGLRQLAISNTASAVNYVQTTGAATGSGPTISAQGSDTNIGLIFNTKGSGISAFTGNSGTHFAVRTDIASATNYWQVFGDSGSTPRLRTNGGNATLESGAALPFVFATNANSSAATQFIVNHTASAVNYIQVTGNATNGAPTISALGSDANVYLDLKSKGNLQISLYTGGGIQFAALHTASAVNYPTAKGSATGFGVIFGATGSDTNIPLVLQPKGTGALQAQQTDSTATGGNARGANAVDWQTVRDTSIKVASGPTSVVAGGQANYASSFWGVVSGGYNNGNTSFGGVLAGGYQNATAGNYSVSSGGRFNTSGGSAFMVGSVSVGGISNSSLGTYNFIGGGFTNSGTSSSAVTTQSATMNGTTAVTLAASNASIKVGQIISGTSISEDTYVAAISGTSLTLSKVASGSSTSTLSFYTPHGVVVGGGNNQATGSYSFIGGGGDAGTAANRNVASGDNSVVVGGGANTASGIGSFVGGGGRFGAGFGGNVSSGLSSSVVGGLSNSASGSYSFVGGGYANTANSAFSFIGSGTRGTTRSIEGNAVFSACSNPIADANGITQTALLILAKQTTDATATVLTSNGGAGSTINQVIMPNNSAYFFTGEVVAGVTGGGNTKGWFIEGVIKRGANAASTALVGTPTVTSSYADAGASTWVIAVTADTTNGGLAVTFTGQASTTIRTVAQIRTTEMTY